MDSQDELPEVPEVQAEQATPSETPTPQASESEASWSYDSDEIADSGAQPDFGSAINPVEWTASEFVHHDKSASWFVGLAAAAIFTASLGYIIVGDFITIAVVLIAAVLFGVMANRKPQTLTYRIDSKGITIGPKLYPFTSFKSFSVILDSAIAFVQLMPMSRVSPPYKRLLSAQPRR